MFQISSAFQPELGQSECEAKKRGVSLEIPVKYPAEVELP
jgi:hypothetical protein